MEEAVEHFRSALRLDPGNVQTRINLAMALKAAKQNEAALRELRVVLRAQPHLPLALTYACEILSDLGRTTEAVEMLRGAISEERLVAPLRFLLGRYLEQLGDAAAALSEYKECERLDRGNPQALTRIAWIQSTSLDERLRDGDEAIRYAKRAVATTERKNVRALDALAAAHAEAGQFKQAMETAEEALQLALAQGHRRSAEPIRHRLELYRDGRPYRTASNVSRQVE